MDESMLCWYMGRDFYIQYMKINKGFGSWWYCKKTNKYEWYMKMTKYLLKQLQIEQHLKNLYHLRFHSFSYSMRLTREHLTGPRVKL